MLAGPHIARYFAMRFTSWPLARRAPLKPRSPIDKAKGYEVVWTQVSGIFEALRPFENACFVYVIGEADGPLKIGLSKDPISRLRAMQTGNPRRLRIEYVLAGDMALEKLLHELWEPFAVYSMAGEAVRGKGNPNAAPGTEWFKPEAREMLLPILADAVKRQLELLTPAGDVELPALERAVRDAHAESGFVAKRRDQTRLLGAVVGYSVQRPSRI